MRKKAIVRHVAKKVPTQGRQRGRRPKQLPVAGKSGSNGTRTRWAADFLEGVEEDQSDEEIFYRSSNGNLRYLMREPDGDRLKSAISRTERLAANRRSSRYPNFFPRAVVGSMRRCCACSPLRMIGRPGFGLFLRSATAPFFRPGGAPREAMLQRVWSGPAGPVCRDWPRVRALSRVLCGF